MAQRVFISYRRDDAKWPAHLIYRELQTVLPKGHVFMDVDAIPPGVDFVKYLDGWVAQCDILLALIGPGWLDAADPKTGRRRLDDENDFVRIEIRRALARDIPVVPVLLDRAPMPRPEELPDDIRALAFRNAVFVEDTRADTDVRRMIQRLGLDTKPGPRVPVGRWAVRATIAGVAAVGLGIAVNAFDRFRDGPQHEGLAKPEPSGAAETPGTIEPPETIEESTSTEPPPSIASPGSGEPALAVATPPTRIESPPPQPERSPPPPPVERPKRSRPPPRVERERGSADARREDLEVFRDCPTCPPMVVIPAGSFQMGDNDGRSDEKPAHPVRIARRFAIGQTEVTFDQYDACTAAEACRRAKDSFGRSQQPVVNVSYDDAQRYVAWLSKNTGQTYRLPSEAEWEYATRAGTTGDFSFDGPISTSVANYDGNYTYRGSPKGEYRARTVAAGSLPANPWGLHEVHGNVWEWVQDCWHPNYKNAPRDGPAWMKSDQSDCSRAVVRGGSWYNSPVNLRSAYRLCFARGFQSYVLGFRVARTLTP